MPIYQLQIHRKFEPDGHLVPRSITCEGVLQAKSAEDAATKLGVKVIRSSQKSSGAEEIDWPFPLPLESREGEKFTFWLVPLCELHTPLQNDQKLIRDYGEGPR